MQKRQWIFGFGIFLVLAVSCGEFETLSPIPEIQYKSFNYDYVYDSSLDQSILMRVLEFTFVDGDADLGVYDDVHKNTNYPDSVRYGIFISLHERVDGAYYERFFTEETEEGTDSAGNPKYRTDTLVLHQLFPYESTLDRVGQNKTVQGTVRVGLLMTNNLPYDTMRLEFYIRDRALHKSNIEYTDDFTNEVNAPPGI